MLCNFPPDSKPVGIVESIHAIPLHIQFLFIFFLFQFRVFLGDRTLCDCQNGKCFSCLRTFLDHIRDHIDIIRDLRDQDHIRAACDSRVKRHMTDLVSHYFYNKDTAVRCCRRMDPVDRIGCNIHGALKAKRHIRSPQIIVDRLRERDHIQPLLPEQVCCLMCTVSA